jgi:tyrosinase
MEHIMQHIRSRRTFLKNMGTLAALSTFSSCGGCEELAERIRNRPMRRFIRSGSPELDQMLQIYSDAVAAMKALPSTDRRNWSRQAQIHTDHCPHGNWFFLPWHRAYLGAFEQICRKLTNRADFGLPYWNWQLANGVPPQFMNSSSPLFDPSRNSAPGAVPDIVSARNMETIQSFPDFFTFGSDPTTKGQLESGPHDTTHGGVGGNMGRINSSPLDPVFWTHHCMIDYCWMDWNFNRENDNPSDTAWTGHSFNDMFCDSEGNPIAQMSPGLTILYPLLSYQYEPSTIGTSSIRTRSLVRNKRELNEVQDRLEKGVPINVQLKQRIPLAQGLAIPLERGFNTKPVLTDATALEKIIGGKTPDRAILTLDFPQGQGQNDYFVRVYINSEGNNDPGMDSIYYAGSFGFFGNDQGMTKATSYRVDVTETVAKLKKEGKIGANNALSIQLVPVSFGEPKPFANQTLQVSNLSLDFSTVTTK